MTKRHKITTWTALVLSLPAAGYAGMSVIFYAWLNAAQPDRWPIERAALWVYGSLALSIFFLALFVYCVMSLVRNANKPSKAEKEDFEDLKDLRNAKDEERDASTTPLSEEKNI